MKHQPSPNDALNKALDASFSGYQPCDRPIHLGDIMARLRATYHSACPVPDAELKIVTARYAEAHGFKIYTHGNQKAGGSDD